MFSLAERGVLCYIYVVFIVKCNIDGGTRNGTRTDHGRSGRHVVSAHGHRHRRCENRRAQTGGQADPFQPAGLSGGARHDRELLPYGVQYGNFAQPAGLLWDEPAGPAHRYRHHAGPHRPPQGQPYPHLPVRLHFFQCGVHGFSTHLGAVRVRGSALCQRLCDRVQHSAVDHGLRLCEREFRPKRSCTACCTHRCCTPW